LFFVLCICCLHYTDKVIILQFWSNNGSPHTGTPTTLYSDIVRKIAIDQHNTVGENILLFTLLNIAVGNTGISTWQSKFKDNLWRPVISIRDNTTTPESYVNETWKPLGASRSNGFEGEINFTPPFPSYTSGHAAFGCAAFQMVANFYGTYDIHFEYTAVEFNGKTTDQFNRVRPCLKRSYSSLIEVMSENAASRVWNGVHYSFDSIIGCNVGISIANKVWEKFTGKDALTTDEISRSVHDHLNNTPTSGYEPDFCSYTPPFPFVW